MSTTEKIADRLGELFALQGERIRATIAAGLVETKNALRLRGARVVGVIPNAPLVPAACRLVGWSLRAGSGGPAVLALYDAREAFGEPVAVVTIPADGTDNHSFPGGGVSITEALFFAVTSGTVAGSLYLGAVD